MSPDSWIGIANLAGDALALAALALGFYVRTTAAAQTDKRCDATDEKQASTTNALYARLNSYGDRIMRLESVVDDMPRTKDVYALSLQISGMAGDLKAIAAKMEAIEHSSNGNANALRRLEDHVLKVEK